MSYYNTCKICGANLDPGEPCDCQEEKETTDRQQDTQYPDKEKDRKQPA